MHTKTEYKLSYILRANVHRTKQPTAVRVSLLGICTPQESVWLCSLRLSLGNGRAKQAFTSQKPFFCSVTGSTVSRVQLKQFTTINKYFRR
jgi:hypothetical protein